MAGGVELMIWMLLLLGVAVATTNEADNSALVALSKGWTGTDLGWNGDPCAAKWQGVTCDMSRTNITKLILSTVGLVGRLLPSIGQLSNLQTLDMSFNPNLGGQIPKELGLLVNLQYLSLQGCTFTGDLPMELGQLKNLKFLGLNMNKLTGNIPPAIGGLSLVEWFDLSENSLSGELPVSTSNAQNIGLDNLTSAKHFHLNNNSLTGSLPKEITTLPKLIHLLLDSNAMSGNIPEELGNFKSLQILRLDNNMFKGPVPNNISQILSLTEIHLRNNRFTGTFPDLSDLSDLMLLSVGMNKFDAKPVPPSILTLGKLQTLEFDQANVAGTLPKSIFSLPLLETMSFVGNSIDGTVSFLGATQSLAIVTLNKNKIVFATDLPRTPQFQISMGDNPICNSNFQPLLINCSSGSSPEDVTTWKPDATSCKRKCRDGKILNPDSCLCAFPLLVDLQFNAPTFSVMNKERDDKLRKLLADGLQLSVTQVWIISTSFSDNFRLLAHAAFFPSDNTDRWSKIESSAIISQLSLQQVKLTGFEPYHASVPENVIKAGKSNKALKTGAIVGICAAVIIIGGVAFYAMRQKFKADKAVQASNPFATWESKGSGNAPQLKGVKSLSFAELKKATNNFSKDSQIGVGGYGKVYKGYIQMGEQVAIKRAQAGSMQGATEFKTEIELLSRLHHKNLVALVGFCYELGEQMLVYEYMPNGTIRDHLFEHSKMFRTWNRRVEVALGAARGLEYLHDLANPTIIHRDIKSTNILLSDHFVAKVADFGLSKVAQTNEGDTHVSTQVKGTLGYLDPEYYMTQQLTEKSDVYSFGVVLLEMMTARPPIEEGKYVVRELRTAFDKGGMEGVLPYLDEDLEGYQLNQMEDYLNLALSCVEEAAANRPTMNQVVKELEIILSQITTSTTTSFTSSTRFKPRHSSTTSAFEYSGGFTLPNTIEPK